MTLYIVPSFNIHAQDFALKQLEDSPRHHEWDTQSSQVTETYKYEIYDGAGHAYMRSGDDPSGSQENKKARDDSFQRVKKILGQ